MYPAPDDFLQTCEKLYDITDCNFTLAMYADTINLLANHFNIYPAHQNAFAKEVGMDVMILTQCCFKQTLIAPSNLIYALRRAAFYSGLLSSTMSTMAGKTVNLSYNIFISGWQGVSASVTSHLGTKFGFFVHEKVLAVLDSTVVPHLRG